MVARRPGVRVLIFAACFVAIVCGADRALAAERSKRVLIVHASSPLVEQIFLQDSAIRSAIKRDCRAGVLFVSEYLNLRTAPSADFREQLGGMLAAKYAGNSFDLIVATDRRALDFFQNGAAPFAGVPLVYSISAHASALPVVPERPTTGVVEDLHLAETMSLALQLHPETRRLIVMTSKAEQAELTRLLSTQRPGIEILWLDAAEADDAVEKASRLGAGDVVLLAMQELVLEGTGRSRQSWVSRLCRESGAPVYACSDVFLGRGIVGGRLISPEWQASEAGVLAARILNGENPADIPPVTLRPDRYTVDARALARWGIAESALPERTIVRFSSPSFFNKYKWYLLGALVGLIIESVVIVHLLASMARVRKADRALRRERDVLDAIMRSTHTGIMMVAPDGSVRFANRFASELFGRSHAELLQMSMHDPRWEVYEPGGRRLEPGEFPFDRILETGRGLVDVPLAIRKGTGEWVHLSVTGAPLKSGEGALDDIVFTFDDVTSQKRVEELLIQSRDDLELRVQDRTVELIEANRQLRGAIRDLRRAEMVNRRHQDSLAHAQRLATMGEMATGLAHEINQPLAAIVSYTQGCIRRLNSQSPNREELQGALAAVSEQAQRAGEIIRRIRAFLRKEKPQTGNLSLNDVARNAAAMIRADALSANVTLRLELAEDVPLVQADAIQLEQVVLNLLRNAIEAIKSGPAGAGVTTLRTGRTADDRAMLEVSDDGPGMSPEVRAHLFEPFYTTKSGGLGMGLAISRSIVEAHSGRMQFVERPDAGTTVQVTFPAGHASASRLSAGGEPAVSEP